MLRQTPTYTKFRSGGEVLTYFPELQLVFLLTTKGRFVRTASTQEFHTLPEESRQGNDWNLDSSIHSEWIDISPKRDIVLFSNKDFFTSMPLYNKKNSVYPSDKGFEQKDLLLMSLQTRTIIDPNLSVLVPKTTMGEYYVHRLVSWHGTK